VQTGIGRTGQWFAFQHSDIEPDVISLAKGLGNGLPIGACLAKGRAADTLQAGSHGSTFGGNPLVCRAALTVLDTIKQEQLLTRANTLGKQIRSALNERLGDTTAVVAIRGKGLMIGIELQQDCTELLGQALNNGLLISVQAGRVIRLLPPLTISDDEAQQIVDRVTTLIKDFVARQAA